VAQVDSTLFERYPITHIAVDPSAYENALRNYPMLSNAKHVASYFIRDVEVTLYNICGVFDNVAAARYKPSGYERALFFHQANQIDSTQYALSAFMETSPTTRSTAIFLTELLLSLGNFDQAQQVLRMISICKCSAAGST